MHRRLCDPPGMASPSEDPPPKPAPAKPLTDLDFHSGVQIAELNQLIQEHQARSPDGRKDPELFQAKDLVFSLLAQVQRTDGKLPPVNRYLLLFGGTHQGTVHINGTTLCPLSPGSDYDTCFTLLVPVLNVAGVPVTLDMTQSPPGHARISLQPFDAPTQQRWSECSYGDETFLSAELVSEWFFRVFSAAAKDVRVELRGRVTSVIVCIGSYRVLYDIVPVVAFQGWPEVAQPWLSQGHFWDGKLRDEDVTVGFYLFPSASGSDWYLSFSASELPLWRVLPLPLLWSLRATTAALPWADLQGLGPYHLFTLALWSCERLPSRYLAEEENAAHALLGVLDDLSASLAEGHLPNYFLPQWNLLQGVSPRAMKLLVRAVAQVRANPSKYLRQAVEEAKEAKRRAKTYRRQLPTPGDP
ncbi:protein MB21D2-like isoform X1 [Pseudonaja textilis]|uniref:protein MB21D2-like isoform X1 n=2 Tax=Pseudonaja textilis TaxID=8673 RepID=UPI000EA9C3F1|nr:protein MB21D2-like isoform X1 [Pseudonaja textilis]